MATLDDALFEAISGRPATWQGAPLDAQMRALVDASGGSMRAAARLLDEPKSSFRYWVTGQRRPSKAAIQRIAGKLSAILRRAWLRPAEEARLRARQPRIEGTDRYDGRPRNIKLGGKHLHPGAMGRVIDAYLAGRSTRAALTAGISDTWYRNYFSSDDPDFGIDVERVTLE